MRFYIVTINNSKRRNTELNRKTIYENQKMVSIPSKTSTRIYSDTFSGGIYEVSCTVGFEVNQPVATALIMKKDDGSKTATVRGEMTNGGGMHISRLVDAREKDITVDTSVHHGYAAAVQATCIYWYKKL